MRIHLKALGCRLNEAELETWSRHFQARGHQIAADAESADLVVINTCAVTAEAVRKSRKLLRRSQRRNPTAKLLVSGCYASLDPTATQQIPGVDLLVANRDKDRLVEIAHRELNLHAMPDSATAPGANPLLTRGRQRAFVKVQDGCRYRCSFCIVTLARGEERSRPITEIVTEVNRLYAEGIREVVLTGVHIGGYGSDRGADLSSLVRAVLADTDMPRVRLGSVEPWDLPERFWTLFEDTRFMPHLHLPLQSGADSVLRRMARHCGSAQFARLVDQARRRVADFNVTTDIIVGFPGESESEWQQTLAFVAGIGFSHLHIFAFSAREGTKAARLPGQIPSAVKRERSAALHRLGARLKRETLRRHVGRRFPVLVEGPARAAEDPGVWFGYTPNFLPVRVQADTDAELANQIVTVEMQGLESAEDALRGRARR